MKTRISRIGRRLTLTAGLLLVAVAAFLLLRRPTPDAGKIVAETIYEESTDLETFLHQAKRRLSGSPQDRNSHRYLSLGGTPFEIGGATAGKAWFYLNHPLLDDHPQWELALTSRRALEEVTIGDIGCRFFKMNDPEGASAFGSDWHRHAVRIPERRVVLIRALTNETVTYAVELATVYRGPGVSTKTAKQLFRGQKGRPRVEVRHLRMAQPAAAGNSRPGVRLTDP